MVSEILNTVAPFCVAVYLFIFIVSFLVVTKFILSEVLQML